MNIELIQKNTESNKIIDHPFLVKLRTGGYNQEQLKVWVSQQYYFSNQFPRCLGALWCRIPDCEISLPLMKFLAIEHWGSQFDGAHWKLYKQVLNYFKIDLNTLKHIPAFEETGEYLNFRLNLCLHNSIEEGLGCIGFAHELINANIFKSYYEGFKKVEGIPDSATEYFRSHVDDEPEDFQIFKKIILSYVHTEEGMKLVEKGAFRTIEKRIAFFDKIKERLDSI